MLLMFQLMPALMLRRYHMPPLYAMVDVDADAAAVFDYVLLIFHTCCHMPRCFAAAYAPCCFLQDITPDYFRRH